MSPSDGCFIASAWIASYTSIGAEVLGPIVVKLVGADAEGSAPEEFDVYTLVVPEAVIG